MFQIRRRHRNDEVRELIPADYAGVMITDRGKSYDAEKLLGVPQQKCLDHLKENIHEVLERKTGRARSFGLTLQRLLGEARQLWRDQRAGKAQKFQVQVERIEKELTWHLRPRRLQDPDNQRRFLHNPAIEPTNNRGERTLRLAVIVRKLSHGSKNARGAEAFASFTSIIQTAAKKQCGSIINALQSLFQSNSHNSPSEAHPPPG